MKKIFLAMLAIAAMVLGTSCSNDDGDDDATLLLSETSLDLAQTASETNLTVTTNQNEWSAIGSAEWMDVSKNGNTLVLKTLENTSTVARKGKVLVIAGNANATVEVVQKGAEGSATITPEEIAVGQYASEYKVDVNANTKDWSATTDAAWITLTAKPYKSELVVEVTENTVREERIGKIILTVGAVNKEITVKQSGILFFLTPYTEIGSSISKIIEFETARKSILVKQPDGLFNNSFWDFNTTSPMFSKIRYNVKDEVYKEAVSFAADKEILKTELDNFKAFLEKNGFTKKEDLIYHNEEKSLEVKIEPESQDPHVVYKYVPKQPQAYPTFAKFPYGYMGWGKIKADIDVFESKNAGVLNEELSKIDDPETKFDYLYYDVKDSKDLEARAYFVYPADQPNPGMVETAQYYTNKNLVFYEDKGDIYFTNEFTKLYQKEGFKYKGFNKWHRFENTEKNLTMVLRWVKYSDMDHEVLDIHLHQSADNTASFVAPYLQFDMPEEAIKAPLLMELAK